MKVLFVVGARPQFVKLAPLSREVRQHNQEVIVHTGQHFDKNMSDNFFVDLAIPAPAYNLNVNGGGHGQQTGRMMVALEEVLLVEQPDVVVVFGDTNSTLAGALVAAKLQIPVAHIEAGLRSFNRAMPEEINRILTDHTSDFLFAPTDDSVRNLQKEGLEPRTFFVGDIIVDVMGQALEKAHTGSDVLTRLKLTDKTYSLLTLHRPYTVDNPVKLRAVLDNLGRLPTTVLFPIHPRTRHNIDKFALIIPDNIRLLDSQGYLDFLMLQAGAERIITDSGGIQKEAYILGKPCVTLRPETEWVETVEVGWNLLIKDPTQPDFVERVLAFNPKHERPAIFGEQVAKKIVNILTQQVQDNFGKK